MRKYLIIPVTITGSIDYNEVDMEPQFTSLDGSETFVRYESGSRPSFYNENYSELNIEQAYSLFKSSDWGLSPKIDIEHIDI